MVVLDFDHPLPDVLRYNSSPGGAELVFAEIGPKLGERFPIGAQRMWGEVALTAEKTEEIIELQFVLNRNF
jgi:hypothetical protein